MFQGNRLKEKQPVFGKGALGNGTQYSGCQTVRYQWVFFMRSSVLYQRLDRCWLVHRFENIVRIVY